MTNDGYDTIKIWFKGLTGHQEIWVRPEARVDVGSTSTRTIVYLQRRPFVTFNVPLGMWKRVPG